MKSIKKKTLNYIIILSCTLTYEARVVLYAIENNTIFLATQTNGYYIECNRKIFVDVWFGHVYIF